jgi:Protein of unknown function (DUF3015)
MLKRLLIVQVTVMFLASQAGVILAAGVADTGPGCGFGKVWFQNYPHTKTKGAQILIATSNSFFGSQTFGISTGTLGCTDNGKWWAEVKTTMFAELNFEALSQEMAQGKGEHLASLATLMGVPAEHQAEFFAMTQEQYTPLVQVGETSPVALVKALNQAISAHPVLANVSMNR